MTLEDVRRNALNQIERTERMYTRAFLLAAAAEVVVLAALLWAAETTNRTHLLLLIGFVGSYSIVVLAIVALGSHVSRIGQQILRAIDLAAK